MEHRNGEGRGVPFDISMKQYFGYAFALTTELRILPPPGRLTGAGAESPLPPMPLSSHKCVGQGKYCVHTSMDAWHHATSASHVPGKGLVEQATNTAATRGRPPKPGPKTSGRPAGLADPEKDG